MDQRVFIAQLNIEHYRRRLDGNQDDGQRRIVEQLLAEEEAKLSSLRAASAEGILSDLLDLLASWASRFLDGRDHLTLNLRWAELAAIFDQMPCAMSLIDGSGKIVLANTAMRGFIGDGGCSAQMAASLIRRSGPGHRRCSASPQIPASRHSMLATMARKRHCALPPCPSQDPTVRSRARSERHTSFRLWSVRTSTTYSNVCCSTSSSVPDAVVGNAASASSRAIPASGKA
ncbi:hypothetical protein [Aminobacter ciceronei]|uniref:PAS domain-containing protein n=1 Tax=Aminobacter ciceronei TaxID=150723 RepID=A0ABR6CF06_9HYPH|nr:hypothetical protein [Aminobacter ciceronei]MBA8909856.1 hypothetical protein [Aminobacter ciceronei]MBA9023628.1 hypothetical protein [Aminobacter ciceronei]